MKLEEIRKVAASFTFHIQQNVFGPLPVQSLNKEFMDWSRKEGKKMLHDIGVISMDQVIDITPDQVMEIVVNYYRGNNMNSSLTVKELKGQGGYREISDPRSVSAIFIERYVRNGGRKLMNKEIGEIFGKNHCYIHTCHKRLNDICFRSPKFKSILSDIELLIIQHKEIIE